MDEWLNDAVIGLLASLLNILRRRHNSRKQKERMRQESISFLADLKSELPWRVADEIVGFCLMVQANRISLAAMDHDFSKFTAARTQIRNLFWKELSNTPNIGNMLVCVAEILFLNEEVRIARRNEWLQAIAYACQNHTRLSEPSVKALNHSPGGLASVRGSSFI